MDAFRLAGVRDYFLFTDTTCDVGFYVHRGLTQVCEQSLPASVPGENPSSFYLYEGRCPSRRDVPAVGQTLVGLSTSWYAGIPSTGQRRRG